MVKDSIPADQIRHVEAGDEMSVYAIDGSASNGPRRLTIWYNKEVAAIETSEGSIWGDWDEDKLLLTEEFEEAQDVDGSSVGGRIVYNLFGHRGIYSSGNFYTIVPSVTDQKIKALADEHLKLATEAKVNGTPTFFVNGKVVIGADTDGLNKAIEQEK